MADAINGDYDWATEVKNFHETKVGVKGLADTGITKIPKLFEHPQESLERYPPHQGGGGGGAELPTIDLRGDRREVVEEIRRATKEWGFFRIVNHTIPLETMDAMVAAAKRFHELPDGEKAPYYSTEAKRVRFDSHLPTRENDAACWRDLLTFNFLDGKFDPDEIPSPCREEVVEYLKYMVELREFMAELLSEALGLPSDYLSRMECMKSQSLACVYYPKCPEPQKTLGSEKHTDLSFLTLLLHDDVSGLQVLHDNQWIDVPPVRGSIVANIGDVFPIVSNENFISVEHRVIPPSAQPRVTVSCFIIPSIKALSTTTFGPIKELLSDENPAKFREFKFDEFRKVYMAAFGEDTSAYEHFRI